MRGWTVNGSGGVLEPGLSRFVDLHVNSLVGWEIVLFFHAHPAAVLDLPALADRLGRRVDDIHDDVGALERSGIVSCRGGLVRYAAPDDIGTQVDRFADACSDRSMRIALVAQVLGRIEAAYRPD